jgi:hypothetical protein
MTQSIPLTKGNVAIVDDQDYASLSQWRWRVNSKGYAIRSEYINGKEVVYCMHRIILGAERGQYVDHIDHNRLNNVRSNLRLCTQSQNQANRRLQKNSTTGYKGVTRRGDRWHARIWVEGKCIHLGYHANAYRAALIYDHAARRFFGEFAALNYPNGLQTAYFDAIVDGILSGTTSNKEQLTEGAAGEGGKRVSRFRGVWWEHGQWRAAICHRGKRRHLGYFTSEEAAANAYQNTKALLEAAAEPVQNDSGGECG